MGETPYHRHMQRQTAKRSTQMEIITDALLNHEHLHEALRAGLRNHDHAVYLVKSREKVGQRVARCTLRPSFEHNN